MFYHYSYYTFFTPHTWCLRTFCLILARDTRSKFTALDVSVCTNNMQKCLIKISLVSLGIFYTQQGGGLKHYLCKYQLFLARAKLDFNMVFVLVKLVVYLLFSFYTSLFSDILQSFSIYVFLRVIQCQDGYRYEHSPVRKAVNNTWHGIVYQVRKTVLIEKYSFWGRMSLHLTRLWCAPIKQFGPLDPFYSCSCWRWDYQNIILLRTT